MINEGAKILEEKKAIRASDIDVVWVNGYGWPVYRGGPMYYGDQHRPRQGAGQDEGIPGEDGRRSSSRRALLEKLVAEARSSRT